MSEEIKSKPPTLCHDCAILVESSSLELVKVGGMNIGLHRQPLVWRLRDKYSTDVINKNAELSRKLAALARALQKSEDSLKEYQDAAINLRDVSGRYHTQKACERILSLIEDE